MKKKRNGQNNDRQLNLYRSVFEHFVSPVLITDKKGYIVEANPAALELFGYKEITLLGMEISRLIDEDFEKWNGVSGTEKKEKEARGELTGIRQNGEKFLCEYSLAPVSDGGGEVLNCIMLFERSNKKLTDEWFRLLIQKGGDMISILNPGGIFQYASPSYKYLLGYEPDDLIGVNAFELVHPEDKEFLYEEFIKYQSIEKATSSPYRFRRNDGSYIWIQSTGTNLIDHPVFKGVIVNSVDISESHYYSRLDKLEQEFLKKNVAGEDLQITLNEYVEGIEDLHEGMLCSVLIKEENRLYNLVSPNLPKSYIEAINGIEIGENQGACGTAAFIGEKVIISDAENDKRTEKFLNLVEKYQFKALWSYPVLDEDHKVIATFAAYYNEPKEPGGSEQKTVARAAQLLQVIFKSQRTLQALNESSELFKYVNKATDDVIYDYDVIKNHINVGESFEKLFGHSPAGKKFPISEWMKFIHPDDQGKIDLSFEKAIKNPEINKWVAEYRFRKKGGNYANVIEKGYIIRDENENAVRMIGVVIDISERKKREQLQSLYNNISRLFNESSGVRESLKSALYEIKLIGNFQLAEVWLTSHNMKSINLSASIGKEVKRFYDSDNDRVSFKYGEGLPGLTWKAGKTQFWGNPDKRKSFARSDAAKKAGLKIAYGLPITYDEEVIGVLVLGASDNAKPAHNYKPILEEIASYLGGEIHRKKLEEELLRIFSSVPDIICIAGFDGYFRKVNPAMSELLGYSEKELLTTPIVDFTHPEDRNKTEQEMEALNLGGGKRYFENRYITKSGNVVWLSWTTRIFKDEAITFSVAKDVTKQKELEELLEQANRLAKIGSWEVNLVENKIYWSDITREIHEAEPDFEPDFDTAISFYKEGESREKITETIQQSIDNGTAWDLELLIITAKGNERWIRAIGEAELVEGKCVRLYGSFQDIHQRKTAEIAFKRASEERVKILESIDDCFFAVNRDWTVTYWNQMAEQVLGMPRDKIVGQNLWETFESPTDRKFYTQGMRAMEKNCSVNFEDYDPATEKWFGVSAYPSQQGLSIYFKDITERKEAETQILEISRQLDAIAMFNGLLIKSDDWLQALDECLALFGEVTDADRVYYFKKDEGKAAGDETTSMKIEWVREGIKPEIDNPAHQNQSFSEVHHFIEALIEKRTYNQIVNEIENKEFREFLQQQDIKSILAVPVFTGSNFRGFIGFDDCSNERIWNEEEISFLQTIAINLASVIENEDAEIALQKAFDEKNEILESIGDGFFAVDNEFTVTYWNNQAEKLLHTSKEKIIGHYLWDRFDKDAAPESFRKYSMAINEQVTVHFEDYYEPINRWFEVSAYPSQMGLSVFFKDVTERKKWEEELKELNRSLELQAKELATSNAELEQFAFVASHDLQEPLRMITSFLNQLEKKYDHILDEKGKKYIHFATDGAKRMRQIIRDLLDYSRVGRTEVERTNLEIGAVLDDVLILNKKLIKDKNATVTWGEMPSVYASKSPMQQLFQNLINNALNYQKKGSKPVVKIWAEDEDSHWKFFIQDNGIGINPDYSDKIFNLFQRLHGKDEYSGTGVGLAICKKIVEDYGGRIGVDSEEGKGSTFFFTIAKTVES